MKFGTVSYLSSFFTFALAMHNNPSNVATIELTAVKTASSSASWGAQL
jgi:hypothetical protein